MLKLLNRNLILSLKSGTYFHEIGHLTIPLYFLSFSVIVIKREAVKGHRVLCAQDNEHRVTELPHKQDKVWTRKDIEKKIIRDYHY